MNAKRKNYSNIAEIDFIADIDELRQQASLKESARVLYQALSFQVKAAQYPLPRFHQWHRR